MRGTRTLLWLQAATTGVTGLILFAAPEAIPSSFGLTLTPDAHLLCYFYGATEFSLCFASLAAMRLSFHAAFGPAFIYFAVVHAAEGFAGVFAVSHGAPAAVLANSAAHLAIALLFAWAASNRPSVRPVFIDSGRK